MSFDENLLQYSRPGNGGECELVIGVDFGTSASKVVIQSPDLPGHQCYAVDFGRFSHSSAEYLLPTKLWITQNGTCHLESVDGASIVNDIKLELFSGDMSLNSNRGPGRLGQRPEPIAVAYLALLLRFVRRWFLETKHNIVGHFSKLNWSVNLGVPSPCIEDNEENRRFKHVGKAAWMLSTLEENITIEKALKELQYLDDAPEYWDRDDDGLACDFEIIPEIAAGAVGYALSDLRREGLHVMVDIGASTVDICSFILYESEESNRYSLLTADVQLLGTIKLHIERILALKSAYEKQAENLRDKHDPLSPLAEDMEPYLLSRESLESEVRRAEVGLKDQFQKMVHRVIWDAKCNRDPNSKIWRGGRLPILLIGGGSELSFFSSAVKEIDGWLKQYARNNGAMFLTDERLPERLISKSGKYSRLAVAWGLSHRALDIGKITPADRIHNIDPPSRLEWEDRFISKDQV